MTASLSDLPPRSVLHTLRWSLTRSLQSAGLAAVLSAGLLHLPEGQNFFLISAALLGSVNLAVDAQQLPTTQRTLGRWPVQLPSRQQLLALILCLTPLLSVQIAGAQASPWAVTATLLLSSFAVRGLQLHSGVSEMRESPQRGP